jgi:hypothetical protein
MNGQAGRRDGDSKDYSSRLVFHVDLRATAQRRAVGHDDRLSVRIMADDNAV